MNRQPSRRGFSLIELLVVITVIAVLIGLLVPAIYAVRQAVNRTHCANNLRQVGMAYHSFLDAHRGRATAFAGDPGWMNQLKPYLGNHEDIYLCVNAPKPTIDRSVESKALAFLAASLDSGDGTVKLWESYEVAVDLFEGQEVRKTVSFLRVWTDDPTASYGISSKASKLELTHDSQKVLALDYSRAVIYPGIGQSKTDVWPTEAAQRHGGSLNVLFLDGSVRGMSQADINPTVVEIYNEYWRPWILR